MKKDPSLRQTANMSHEPERSPAAIFYFHRKCDYEGIFWRQQIKICHIFEPGDILLKQNLVCFKLNRFPVVEAGGV